MSSSPRTAYCVDCYADRERITPATRKFNEDDLCDPHYFALCKDMGVKPEIKHPAATARLQDRSVASVSSATDQRGIADAAIHKTRSSRSVSSGPTAGTLTRAVGMPNCGSRQDGITSEHRNQARQGGETPAIVSTSRQAGSPVAPAAEGGRDRDHLPDSRPASTEGRSKQTSAVNLQPQNPERNAITMPTSETALRNDEGQRVCSCGCGSVLRSRHPYIKGHNITSGVPASTSAPKKRGPKPKAASSSNVPPQQTNGHAQIKVPLQPVITGNGAYLVPCHVSEWAMDRIWLRLTPQEKAQLLFPDEPLPVASSTSAAADRLAREPKHA